MLNPRFMTRLTIVLAILCAVPWARPASAQTTRPAVEFAAGILAFPDDGIEAEGFVGGNFRYYLGPRLSLGPEVAFVSGQNHSHAMLTGNVTFDLLGPGADGRPARVTPFVVAGAGLFHTRETFPFPGVQDFSSTEGALTAGGGVRARIGERLFAGAEMRIGWESHVRLNAMIGIALGK